MDILKANNANISQDMLVSQVKAGIGGKKDERVFGPWILVKRP